MSMDARIIVYDGDKEIVNTVQKVYEVPMLSDEGLKYTDCYVKLHFSIVDDREYEKRNETRTTDIKRH